MESSLIKLFLDNLKALLESINLLRIKSEWYKITVNKKHECKDCNLLILPRGAMPFCKNCAHRYASLTFEKRMTIKPKKLFYSIRRCSMPECNEKIKDILPKRMPQINCPRCGSSKIIQVE